MRVSNEIAKGFLQARAPRGCNVQESCTVVFRRGLIRSRTVSMASTSRAAARELGLHRHDDAVRGSQRALHGKQARRGLAVS